MHGPLVAMVDSLKKDKTVNEVVFHPTLKVLTLMIYSHTAWEEKRFHESLAYFSVQGVAKLYACGAAVLETHAVKACVEILEIVETRIGLKIKTLKCDRNWQTTLRALYDDMVEISKHVPKLQLVTPKEMIFRERYRADALQPQIESICTVGQASCGGGHAAVVLACAYLTGTLQWRSPKRDRRGAPR